VNSADGRPPFNDDIVRRPGRAASERGKLRHFQHDGQITRIRQAPKSKIFRFTGILIYGIQLAIPRPSEGRFAVVTKRWAWDAMDAVASGGRRDPGKVETGFPIRITPSKTTGRKRRSGRRNRVVLAPRPWRYVGGHISLTTGARKAASPGRARISRKTIARGRPGCLGCTCQNRVHSFATFAHGAAGAVGARLSLRPLSERGTRNCKTPGKTRPRECLSTSGLWSTPLRYNSVTAKN
jgi:hypothetical protein